MREISKKLDVIWTDLAAETVNFKEMVENFRECANYLNGCYSATFKAILLLRELIDEMRQKEAKEDLPDARNK